MKKAIMPRDWRKRMQMIAILVLCIAIFCTGFAFSTAALAPGGTQEPDAQGASLSPSSESSLQPAQSGSSETSGSTLYPAGDGGPSGQEEARGYEGGLAPDPGLPNKTDSPSLQPDGGGTQNSLTPDGGSSPPDATEGETDLSLRPENDGGMMGPLAYGEGQITINGIIYWCYANGQAAIRYAKNVTGNFVVPKQIVGINGETYQVTRIEGYTQGEASKGAFQGSAITGLSFEIGSQLYYIGDYAFSSCYGLSGKSIILPDTVTDIGDSAFRLYLADVGLSRLQHPHIAKVSGSLPELEAGQDLALPEEAKQYTSKVDSSQPPRLLHKGARWTNQDLTEAEIRIDYGEASALSGRIDFVFVMDYSDSMQQKATVLDEHGVSHIYPRSLLTNDVVYGISQIILGNSQPGYDNRVALVAFGSSADPPSPIWTLNFTNNPTDIESALFNNPLTLDNRTNYGAGLQGAINLINGRSDKTRKPVVIFLSDGEPNDDYGTTRAQTLRNMKAKVYPIAIYTDPGAYLGYLRMISHNGATAYNASDTETFERIILQVVDEIIRDQPPISISLEDTLSSHFSFLSGNVTDVTVSPGGGSVSLSGDKLTWNLSGCAKNTVHTLLVKVKLKPGTELSATGTLPTNASLKATDDSIGSTSQPELKRYLVHHIFENGSAPGSPLPPEIEALLPPSTGGYKDGAPVSPTDPAATEITLPGGERWVFDGWNPENSIIAGANVTFIGTWRRAALDFAFTKVNDMIDGLAGAEFELYLWEGSSSPAGQDNYVSSANITAGKWRWANTAPIVSGPDGKVQLLFEETGSYQLVETTAPTGYHTPAVQWRFDIAPDGTLTGITSIPENSSVTSIIQFEKIQLGDEDIWLLHNDREATLRFWKIVQSPDQSGQNRMQALEGADFSLYSWTGSGAPPPTALVTQTGIDSGQWTLVAARQSQADGMVEFNMRGVPNAIYQLVETSAPFSYHLPTGQWRLPLAADGSLNSAGIQSIPGADGVYPPKLQVQSSGSYAGKLTLLNLVKFELPAMGGQGKMIFTLAGSALLLFGLAGSMLWRRRTKKAKGGKHRDWD